MALDEPDAAQVSLGAEIRRRRKDHGLTLTDLAAQARISHPFLSQLERGYARPSMTTLERIAAALGTSQVSLMLTAVPEGADLVRSDEGVTLPQEGDKVGYARLLVGGNAAFYPQEQVLSRREYARYFQHEQDEWVYVVAGEIEVDLGDGKFVVLREGDSLYYAGNIPHRWRLVGPDIAKVIVVQASH